MAGEAEGGVFVGGGVVFWGGRTGGERSEDVRGNGRVEERGSETILRYSNSITTTF